MAPRTRQHRPFFWQGAATRENPNGSKSDDADLARTQSSGLFAFSPNQLHMLLNGKASDLPAIGGLHGLCTGLATDSKSGISIDEVAMVDTAPSQHNSTTLPPSADKIQSASGNVQTIPFSERRRIFGENRLPKPKPRSIWALTWLAFNNKLIFLLVASAIASLVFGISQAAVLGNKKESNTGWVESATIIAAIVASVIATAVNDYQKNYRFQKLNARKEERWVTAIRSGRHLKISIFDVVVGDLLRIEAGEIPCADGVLVEAFQIQCNEAHLFGESELIHKIPAEHYDGDSANDPFIYSGSVVSQGIGTYIVTAVGTNSTTGRTAMSLRNEVEDTPLQQKLNLLAKYIIFISSIAGMIYFLILFIRWAVEVATSARLTSPRDKGESFLNIFMLAVTVVIVGVPEGLSLAVAIALGFATTHMLKQNNLVRLLRSCEVMGSATTICSDKTGTLTKNEMNVESGTVGCSQKFAAYDPTPPATSETSGSHGEGKIIPAEKLNGDLAHDVRDLLMSSITLNSTVFEVEENGPRGFVGSSTETALLNFASDHLALRSLAEERFKANIVETFPFDGERKYMATVVKMSEGYRVLVKGAADVIIDDCDKTLEDTDKVWNPREELVSKALSPEQKQELRDTAQLNSQKMLRTIAMAYRDLDSWPPVASLGSNDDCNDAFANFEQVVHHQMTFVAMFALRDPIRPEVVSSIHSCQEAGVFVRMLTGDHLSTAEAIARETGIYTAGGLAMDGPTFRRLTPDQTDAVVPRLQVLARSNADDKAKLVMSLKRLGETVAVTGDGTNDAFALKAADIGFSMGRSGTEVAKQASSIVLMDDNFASIVNALMWGRAVTDGTRRYCQFQFTLNITAAVITIISTLVGDVNSSVFDVTQLLWVNLVMDIIAAVSFSTDSPQPYLLQRQPEPRTAPLITVQMWKMILAQSIYQVAVTFTLHYAGQSTFWTDNPPQQVTTVVFNAFMFMQLFNQINCRRVDNGLDIFAGIFRNPWFLTVQTLTLAGQIAIVFEGGIAFGTSPLTGAQWGWSIVFGLFVIPIGAVARLVPDRWIEALGHFLITLLWPLRKAAELAQCGKLQRRVKQRISGQKEISIDSLGAMTEEGKVQHDHSVEMGQARVGGASTEMAALTVQGSRNDASGALRDDEGPVDLVSAVEAARNNTMHTKASGLCIHPETEESDPVLVPLGPLGKGRKMVPPSQNPEVMQYMAIHHRKKVGRLVGTLDIYS